MVKLADVDGGKLKSEFGTKTEWLPQVFEEQKTDFDLSRRVKIRSLF
jgi:hypothetical protein